MSVSLVSLHSLIELEQKVCLVCTVHLRPFYLFFSLLNVLFLRFFTLSLVFLLGFSDLPLQDQMKLLHGTWLDIICLNIAFRSVPYNGEIRYAADFLVSEEDAGYLRLPKELNIVTRKMIQKMTYLKVEHSEYLLLKAMLLFNPGLFFCWMCNVFSLCILDLVNDCIVMDSIYCPLSVSD